MAVYEYVALDRTGREVRGVIDAGNERDARARLRQGGVYPTSLASSITGGRPVPRSVPVRVGRTEIAQFTRQLATLLGGGVPLEGALGALIEQTGERPLKRVLMSIREDVREGVHFSDALARFERLFGNVYVSMVRAAEASGALEAVLERLAEHAEKEVQLRSRLRAVLTYPIIVAAVACTVLVVLLVFVMPVVSQVFAATGQRLPALTRALLASGQFLMKGAWLLVLVVIAVFLSVRAYGRTQAGRLALDRLKLRLPLVGALVRKVLVGRFARTLATLSSSGVPILAALDIVKDVVGNAVFARAVQKARDEIGGGRTIASPLGRSRVFPPMLIRMIAVGEESGNLEGMLERAAASYEQEAENGLAWLVSLLEPLLILAVGLIVAVVVIAILLPIFEIAEHIG